jgi:hypothetical protein
VIVSLGLSAAPNFPPPWTVEELDACFVVRDANGQALAYAYCEEAAAKFLTRDEARRIASNIAKQFYFLALKACPSWD